jgi:hypothetical protein
MWTFIDKTTFRLNSSGSLFYLVSRTAYWLIMNPDYCNCDEFYKVIEFQDIQYYKSEDDRFGDVKK